MNLTHILELDRMVLAWFNGSDSLFIDSLATTLTSGFTWIPLYVILIYVIIKNNDTMPQTYHQATRWSMATQQRPAH